MPVRVGKTWAVGVVTDSSPKAAWAMKGMVMAARAAASAVRNRADLRARRIESPGQGKSGAPRDRTGEGKELSRIRSRPQAGCSVVQSGSDGGLGEAGVEGEQVADGGGPVVAFGAAAGGGAAVGDLGQREDGVG